MISIENLCVRYHNTGKIALNSISFLVKKGELTAVLGSSGAGKTTLLNMIAKTIGVKEVEIKGKIDIGGGIGDPIVNMVFQDPTLLPWRTVIGNISYGLEIKKIPKKEIEVKTKKAIEMVGLIGTENHYPYQLSLGMRQRVNFARALVCNPNILLLDEPFSALDIKTKKKIQEEFLNILKANEITAIFVTHNPEEAFFMADKVIVFSKSPAKVKTIIENNGSKKIPGNLSEYLELYEE